MQNGTKECYCAAADAGDFRTAGRTDQTCQITAASVCRIGRGKSRCEPSHSVECRKGNPSVAIGIYAAVLHALNNMDKDLLLVAKDDELGRKLQDLELTTRKRAPRNGGD